MAWPIVSDYQDAVLNPQTNFNDVELKVGKPELDAQGFPRPRSGQFACVFRLQVAQRDWAVKCFTHEVKDLQERYAVIDQYLSTAQLPYIVAFDYLPKGIKVRGQWCPILKMEWVKGELLGQYIEKHLNNPAELRQLASQWVEMIKALQAKSIAHGDLQERNIIVVNGQLRLVDYDGMFVPALNGRTSNEIGHRNYQHPQRTAKDFGPYLDNFSAWVIYVSLVALSIDPTLWSRTKAGDEGLLFRKEDFEQPMLSRTLNLLEAHSNPNIRTLATLFRPMLFLPLHQIPPLDGQDPQIIVSGSASTSVGINWWSDHATVEQGTTQSPYPEPSFQSASWILDFTAPCDKARTPIFSHSMAVPRWVAFLSGNSLVLTLGMGIYLPILFPSLFSWDTFYLTRWLFVLSLLTGILICFNGIVLVWHYSKEPAVVGKGTFMARMRKANEPLQQLEASLVNNAKKKRDLQDEENKRKKQLNDKLAQLRDQEKKELDEVQATLTKALASIDLRRRTMDQEEKSKMARLQADIGSKIVSLNQQINSLAGAESAEIGRELAKIQTQHIENYLKRHPISQSPLTGKGFGYASRSTLEQMLLAHGIQTANDVSYARVDAVHGFGPKRTKILVGWRSLLEQEAKYSMPKDLGADVKNSIISKYATQRKLLESQRDMERLKFSAEEQAIREDYRLSRKALDAEQATAQSQASQRIQDIKKRYAQEQIAPVQALAQLAKDYSEEYRLIDDENKQLQQQMFRASWQVAKINREFETYKSVSFSRYLSAVFFG